MPGHLETGDGGSAPQIRGDKVFGACPSRLTEHRFGELVLVSIVEQFTARLDGDTAQGTLDLCRPSRLSLNVTDDLCRFARSRHDDARPAAAPAPSGPSAIPGAEWLISAR